MEEKTLNLAPCSLPSLESGRYSMTVSQETNINECKIEDAVFDFYVTEERVSMSSGEVYSVYPPKDSAGLFGNCLPHIILHRKTFPWDKALKGLDKKIPRAALLVVSLDEGVTVSTMEYKDSKAADTRTLCPKLSDDDIDPKEMCMSIDIPYSLFADILPLAEDLKYMAHIRGVNLDNKVTDSEVKDNWFSCIVSNRYPKEPNYGEESIKHTAFLVSLEGFEKYILYKDERSKDSLLYDKVRMYSLYSWDFCVEAAAYDFYSLSRKIAPNVLKTEFKYDDENIQKLIDLGYWPINHDFREGSHSVSWYRSPLMPQKSKWTENYDFYGHADQLLRYDPEAGMLDITYSAAWQLGRLLALQNKDLSKIILKWRLKNKSEAVKLQNLNLLKSKMNILNGRSNMSYSSVEDLCRAVWKKDLGVLISECSDNQAVDLSKNALKSGELINYELHNQSDLLNILEKSK